MTGSSIKLPDFAAVTSAVRGSVVDENFESTIKEIANDLKPTTNQKILGQARTAILAKSATKRKSSGLVPRQVSGNKANVSTEDAEMWTSAKRLKARRIAEAKKLKQTVTNNASHPGYQAPASAAAHSKKNTNDSNS